MFSSGRELDDGLLDELEFNLLSADVGTSTTAQILDQLRKKVNKQKLSSREQFVGALETVLLDLANKLLKPFWVSASRPFVVLITGVNGVGKTTTIGKLAHRIQERQSFGDVSSRRYLSCCGYRPVTAMGTSK